MKSGWWEGEVGQDEVYAVASAAASCVITFSCGYVDVDEEGDDEDAGEEVKEEEEGPECFQPPIDGVEQGPPRCVVLNDKRVLSFHRMLGDTVMWC